MGTLESHVVRLAKAGVAPLLSGSMGEAHHLTNDERATLIRSARRALDDSELEHVPIISGVGSGSTRSVVQLGKEAAEAGADATIAILSGYYAASLASDRKALAAFWTEISEKSPIPVVIYNCESCALCRVLPVMCLIQTYSSVLLDTSYNPIPLIPFFTFYRSRGCGWHRLGCRANCRPSEGMS